MKPMFPAPRPRGCARIAAAPAERDDVRKRDPLIYSPALGGRQRGVSIITAIFILLLFAALAAFMASLVSTAHITSAQDVQGARAYQAAQAGVEWGLFQLDPNGDAAALPTCFAATVLTAIPGYSVSVACTRYPGAATPYACLLYTSRCV